MDGGRRSAPRLDAVSLGEMAVRLVAVVAKVVESRQFEMDFHRPVLGKLIQEKPIKDFQRFHKFSPKTQESSMNRQVAGVVRRYAERL